MGSLGAPLLTLASDHSAGHLWLEVRAGDQSCALLLVVLCQHVPFVGELCAAFAREGKAAAGTPRREGESAANSYTRGVKQCLLGRLSCKRRWCLLKALCARMCLVFA